MKSSKAVKKIEQEMIILGPKKDVAYEDYRDNRGSSDEEFKDRLYGEFVAYRDRWNELVKKRKKLLGK